MDADLVKNGYPKSVPNGRGLNPRLIYLNAEPSLNGFY